MHTMADYMYDISSSILILCVKNITVHVETGPWMLKYFKKPTILPQVLNTWMCALEKLWRNTPK